MGAFKLFGIILIVAACITAGFLKSFSLKTRCKKLSLFCEGIDMLYQYIEQSGCEIERAVKNSFDKCDFLIFECGKPFCDDIDLKNERSEINDFFKRLGTSAKKTECDRISQFNLKFKKYYCEAEKEMVQKCKIYQTFGICIGLAIGILLI